jgi:putative transposase
MIRRSKEEKREIIQIVEQSQISITITLKELDVPRSTFYRWYQDYLREGDAGLQDQQPQPLQIWNRIPEPVRQQVVDLALEYTDKSPRQLAWQFTDQEGYFLSESSVYRILKGFDLIEHPAFEIITAADSFKHPTKRVHELWQMNFTYFKIIGWGWYYLSTILDDYSRFILAYRLTPTMSALDVQATLQIALDDTGLDRVLVEHRPRLLSDNGSCYLSKELDQYLQSKRMDHTRGAPYHPTTQGKIERYHRSMKNVVNLQNYYSPWELEREISQFVNYYNFERYHESLNNCTPAMVYLGQREEVLSKRNEIKIQTLEQRRLLHLQQMASV